MTQMYGKFALILVLLAFLLSLLGAQAVEPIPVLLKARDNAQKEAWQNSLTAAFGDQELTWVEHEKEADIVLMSSEVMDGEIIYVSVRQNALLRLSSILEPAPPAVLQIEDDVGVYAAGLWRFSQGDCAALGTEATSMPIVGIHLANCAIIAAYHPDETVSEETLIDLEANFEGKERFRSTSINRAWLTHKAGRPEQAMLLLQRSIARNLNRGTSADRAFWYGKRAQFYALDFDFQAALRDLDQAIALDPENPLYFTRKGEVYLLLYEWNNAKDAFDAAIALDPEFALAYFQRGILLSTMTEIEAANADFAMYLALEPRGVYAELARQYGGEG